MEKLNKVCQDLQEQVGDDYIVMVPPSDMSCIIVFNKSNTDNIKRHEVQGYTHIKKA